jgi:hypothetical protein
MRTVARSPETLPVDRRVGDAACRVGAQLAFGIDRGAVQLDRTGTGLGDLLVESREHVLAIGAGRVADCGNREDEPNPHGGSMTCFFEHAMVIWSARSELGCAMAAINVDIRACCFGDSYHTRGPARRGRPYVGELDLERDRFARSI